MLIAGSARKKHPFYPVRDKNLANSLVDEWNDYVKIFVVDDHILFREGLVSLFRDCPDLIVVGEAGSAVEAVEKVTDLKPDLVLLDISLPDGSGLDVMKVILAKDPAVKVVMLTVYESDSLLINAVRNGAYGYLLKTMPMAQVLAAVRGIERGEPAISRKMTQKVLSELSERNGNKFGVEKLSALTPRELDVLKELSQGSSNLEIARRLIISPNTVKIHVHNILQKLGLETRREARKFASLLRGPKDLSR